LRFQSQALDNIEPQTQAANATNAKVIKIKKEVEQAQDNLIQAQQSIATLEKKISLLVFACFSCSFWMACFAVSSACVSCSIAWLFACIFFSNVAMLCCACIKLPVISIH
jgi:hypothetical protein